jgi:hypothetical protein
LALQARPTRPNFGAEGEFLSPGDDGLFLNGLHLAVRKRWFDYESSMTRGK